MNGRILFRGFNSAPVTGMCDDYQNRPRVYREFESGTPECQTARQRWGTQPVPVDLSMPQIRPANE